MRRVFWLVSLIFVAFLLVFQKSVEYTQYFTLYISASASSLASCMAFNEISRSTVSRVAATSVSIRSRSRRGPKWN